MTLPRTIAEKYKARFDCLIQEGESIDKGVIKIPGEYYEDVFRRQHQRPTKLKMDWERFVKWKTNCVSLLDQVIPEKSIHKQTLEAFQQIDSATHLGWGISTLKGLSDDLEFGFLADVSARIETAVASDYMGQAEELLQDGQSGKFDHVPAAVLAGAVLEKSLRTLCDRQNPQVSTLSSRGEPKTMNPLIDDLRKAGVFNEAKAKQLRAWAAIRNHAAHGEFNEFDRTDVEQLLLGVAMFLDDYL